MEYVNVFAAGKKLFDNRQTVASTLGIKTTLVLPNSSSSSQPVPKPPPPGAVLTFTIILLVITIIQIILFLWNIIAIMKFFRVMPIAAGILSVVLATLGFPMFSLITIYASKNMYSA